MLLAHAAMRRAYRAVDEVRGAHRLGDVRGELALPDFARLADIGQPVVLHRKHRVCALERRAQRRPVVIVGGDNFRSRRRQRFRRGLAGVARQRPHPPAGLEHVSDDGAALLSGRAGNGDGLAGHDISPWVICGDHKARPRRPVN